MYRRVAPLVGVGTHLTVNSFIDQILGAGQDANPESPFLTNSTILVLSTDLGSNSLVSAPLRKLCRRPDKGQAPESLWAGATFFDCNLLLRIYSATLRI